MLRASLFFFFQAEDGIRDYKVTGVQTCAFFFQAEDGIRDYKVTGVQTCALPILGDTTVVLHVRDAAGNESTCNAVVHVVDTTAPTITTCAADKTLAADLTCHAAIPNLTGEIVAGDNCGAVTVMQIPAAGTSVGLGDTTVVLQVKDAAGNESACNAVVHVVGTTAPSITTFAAEET